MMVDPRRWLLTTLVPAVVFLTGVVAVLAFSWSNVTQSLRMMEEAELRFARTTGVSLSAAIEAALRAGDEGEARSAVERVNSARNLGAAIYVDSEDRVRFASRIELVDRTLAGTEYAELTPRIAALRTTLRGSVAIVDEGAVAQGLFPVLVDATDPSGRGTSVGAFVLLFDLRAQRAEVIRSALTGSAIGGGFIALLSLLLWLFLRRVLISRIERLHDFSVAFEAGHEVARIPVDGDDEIGRLARRLEKMAQALAQRSRLLRESQKMEAVGRLAGGVAHDFNNLLTVILGNAAMARQRARGDRALLDALSETEHAAESATALTRQLLAFSQQSVTTAEVVDIAEIVDRMSGLLEGVLGPDHDLALEFQPGCLVRIDPAQLEQVVMNLVVNARDATPGGGRIDVRCERVSDASNADEQAVRLSIRDDGPGIAEEDRERIFEPFFTTKPLGSGTGLGLATVFRVVQDAGGRIDLDSRPGAGATFHVTLPRVPERDAGRPSASGPRAAPPVNAAGGRVLVCEDDSAVRHVTAALLRSAGYDVAEVGDGPSALEWLEENFVDVLVTDVLMPGMDGLELGHRVRQAWPRIGLVFVSGFTSKVDPTQLAAFPDSVLLAKPVDVDVLVRAVARRVESARVAKRA